MLEHRQRVAGGTEKMLGICLSSRRNLCIHERVMGEAESDNVDAACRAMTASWVRDRASKEASVETCSFFEEFAE